MSTTSSVSVPAISKFRDITMHQIQQAQKKMSATIKRDWQPNLMGALFYFIPFAVVTTYGGKACPFIEGIPFTVVMQYMFLSLFPIYLIRAFLISRIGRKRMLTEFSDFAYVLFESSFFAVWVALLASIAWAVLNFSSESFIKITVGSALVSVFSVIDLFLLRRKHLIILSDKQRERIQEQKKQIFKQYTSFVSLKLKFVLTSVMVLVLVGTAFSLINYKNYEWLINSLGTIDHWEGLLSVFKETVFVISVFMGLLIVTVILYSDNIIICFTLLSRVIGDIFDGQFDNQLITLSNDEFGVMGENLNIISDELREKQKIKNAFGKLVSPRVAEIMMSDKELRLGGVEKETVMLFSDLRNFTSSSVARAPSEIVKRLNAYFTNMVNFVEGHDGIVDKFMGDGLMALYGYDDCERGVNDAVLSALQMLDYAKTSETVKIGIGIHVGPAILGMIGSPQRLDFTAIGSQVNLTSRLESATKEHNVDMFLSENAYKYLTDENRQLKWKAFSITVKGIEDEIKAYGYKHK